MRILVVSENIELRSCLVAALESNRRTALAADARNAALEIHRLVPDVLIVHVASSADLDVVGSLCALDSHGAMYVLALLGPGLSVRAITAAVAAGSHDVLRMPYAKEELIMRVDARQRLERWSASVEPARAEDIKLSMLRAWRYLDAVVVDDLEGMMCRGLQLTEKCLPLLSTVHLATIPMTLASAELDTCISIAVDLATQKWLGIAMLGDDAASSDVIHDIMRELANVAGGAFKRAALLERAAFATGIPIDSDLTPCGPDARYWEIETEDGATLGLVADVRRRPNRRVQARRLIEGMVVVEDVCNGSGVLLLPSGTRLTATTAERLSRLLDRTVIEVCA
jgi:DNA-binding response OmpR family regulator